MARIGRHQALWPQPATISFIFGLSIELTIVFFFLCVSSSSQSVSEWRPQPPQASRDLDLRQVNKFLETTIRLLGDNALEQIIKNLFDAWSQEPRATHHALSSLRSLGLNDVLGHPEEEEEDRWGRQVHSMSYSKLSEPNREDSEQKIQLVRWYVGQLVLERVAASRLISFKIGKQRIIIDVVDLYIDCPPKGIIPIPSCFPWEWEKRCCKPKKCAKCVRACKPPKCPKCPKKKITTRRVRTTKRAKPTRATTTAMRTSKRPIPSRTTIRTLPPIPVETTTSTVTTSRKPRSSSSPTSTTRRPKPSSTSRTSSKPGMSSTKRTTSATSSTTSTTAKSPATTTRRPRSSRSPTSTTRRPTSSSTSAATSKPNKPNKPSKPKTTSKPSTTSTTSITSTTSTTSSSRRPRPVPTRTSPSGFTTSSSTKRPRRPVAGTHTHAYTTTTRSTFSKSTKRARGPKTTTRSVSTKRPRPPFRTSSLAPTKSWIPTTSTSPKLTSSTSSRRPRPTRGRPGSFTQANPRKRFERKHSKHRRRKQPLHDDANTRDEFQCRGLSEMGLRRQQKLRLRHFAELTSMMASPGQSPEGGAEFFTKTTTGNHIMERLAFELGNHFLFVSHCWLPVLECHRRPSDKSSPPTTSPRSHRCSKHKCRCCNRCPRVTCPPCS